MTHRFIFPVRSALLPLVAALAIAGCASAPTQAPEPLTPPSQFKEQAPGAPRWVAAAPAEAQARGAWWLVFGDPSLTALVERAGEHNTSIQEAAARLAQARALLRQADADRLPQVGLNASSSRQAGANTVGGTSPAALHTAGASVSYELDLFGRLAGASTAAALDAQARDALLQSTRLAVQTDTAQTYLALRALDAEIALVRGTVDAYQDTLRLTERRFQAGDIAELDVERVRTEVASTEADAFALDRRRAALEHALAVLVGDAASSFSVPVTTWTTALPTIPAGVPATVLTRRPDVSAAQSSLMAAQARLGVVRTAWFPDIALTANGGYASTDIGDLLKWSSRAWGVSALLSLPIFDGGRRDAAVQGARAQLDAAGASYRGQVLVAFREVEDQLSSLRLLHDQAEAQARAVRSAQSATAMSDTRYRNGYVSQLDLLDARRSELSNRRQALQVRASQYDATVGLIRSLGGDWGPLPAIPTSYALTVHRRN